MILVRIPIGSTLKDKETFLTDFLKVFPSNPREVIEDIWNRQVSVGVAQIIMEVQPDGRGVITHVMKIGDGGLTYWQLSSNFLNKVPHIKDFKLEELQNQAYDNGLSQSNNSTLKKKEFVLDDILDFISEKGYDKLSQDEKDFLTKYNKRG